MKRSHRFALLAAATAAGFALSSAAEDADASKFLQDAIQTDIAEVQAAKLAMQHSSDTGVKEFAARLQSDHTKSLQEASDLAKTLGVAVPSEPNAEAQQHYAALTNLSGQEFDAAFVNHMAEGHREAITKFGEQTHANPNEAVADLASKTLPTLKEHLAAAESLLAMGVRPSAEAHGAPRDQARPGLQEPSEPPPL